MKPVNHCLNQFYYTLLKGEEMVSAEIVIGLQFLRWQPFIGREQAAGNELALPLLGARKVTVPVL
jgi:hypothetical protein